MDWRKRWHPRGDRSPGQTKRGLGVAMHTWGGSTTIGGVSGSTRRAAVDALELLFAKAAPVLNATPAKLEAVAGSVRVRADPSRKLSWAQACGLMGSMPITVRGKHPGPGNLSFSGVGGV
ncbi:MAG: hypothetical protein HY650_13525 [Acidobacteria bacterium]|nr:hypothetical protein [Acidobacteriota bacterium]